MPFKFWKKEGKKAAPPPEKKPAKKDAPKPAAKPAEVPAPKPAPTKTPEDVAAEVHRSLVDAGLTIEGTREVFKKRLAEKFGSLDAFDREYRDNAPEVVTRFIGSWLGFDIPAKFSLKDLLYSANQRLSSFGVKVDAGDEIDIDETIREATLSLGERTATVQFQTPRDIFKEINRLIEDHGAQFVELETWSEGYSFMLAKKPNWARLAKGDFVIAKAEETATGDAECPECGSHVGARWATCIACNAVLD